MLNIPETVREIGFLLILTTICHRQTFAIPTDNQPYRNQENVRIIQPFQSDDLQPPKFTIFNATHYLRAYGYMPTEQETSEAVISPDDFSESLKAFQRFSEIPETGVLDAATIYQMSVPRCGVKDLQFEPGISATLRSRRRKRYAIEGSYWGVKEISYRISKYSKSMSPERADKIIAEAFQVWQSHSNLEFSRKDSGQANIDVRFARGPHGDGEPFDGRGQILAHAFFPRFGGNVHFDEDEPWATPDGKGIDLYSVAAHEIGHSLGLKHSNNHMALMAPFYQGYAGNVIKLHSDDIKGLQHLYGPPIITTKNDLNKFRYESVQYRDIPTLTKNIPDGDLGNNFDICNDPTIDAITTLGNGSTYAFKGDLYWKLTERAYEVGYPRKISQDWDGLPDTIDAAVTDYDGDTYFLKGDVYWLYDSNGQRYNGYPRKIATGLVDTPDDIDAAMIWNYDDKPYFFKGDQYWQYSKFGMPSSWPRSIKRISELLPSRIDAAFKWTNGQSYLFSGSQYYRVTGWRVMRVVPGYPRNVAEWWFGCKPTDPGVPRTKRSAKPNNYSRK